MTNKEVAQAFVDGAIKGRSLHMFIEGDTLYSYGYHFPIARRAGIGKMLVNADKYSRTTSRHQSMLRQVLSGDLLIIVQTDTASLRGMARTPVNNNSMITI